MLLVVAKLASAGAQTITGPTAVGMVMMVMLLLADERHDRTSVVARPLSCQFPPVGCRLHALRDRAWREHDHEVSSNTVRVRRQQAPARLDQAVAAYVAILSRVERQFGRSLLGLVAIGSWTRGDAARGSDIDVLVVLAPDVAIERRLYRPWDEEPLKVEGRVVDVHFVHCPEPGAQPSALWCEAAVDGVVWHDSTGAIGRFLLGVSRSIAEGRLVRGTTHGQAYWKGAA